MKKGNLLVRFLSQIDLYISVLGLVALVILTFLGTIFRYVFNAPFIWQEEVQMILIVWIVFWGASVAFRTGNHIAIEILVDALPEKAQKGIRIVVDVVTAAALLFIIYVEASRVVQLLESGRATSILKIPQAYNYSGVVLACVFMLIHFVLGEIRQICGGGKEESEV